MSRVGTEDWYVVRCKVVDTETIVADGKYYDRVIIEIPGSWDPSGLFPQAVRASVRPVDIRHYTDIKIEDEGDKE